MSDALLPAAFTDLRHLGEWIVPTEEGRHRRKIEADIETANVEVSGQVTGNIAASDKVELKADCKVVGDIRAPRILIADGAVFKGNVDMDVKEAKGK